MFGVPGGGPNLAVVGSALPLGSVNAKERAQ